MNVNSDQKVSRQYTNSQNTEIAKHRSVYLLSQLGKHIKKPTGCETSYTDHNRLNIASSPSVPPMVSPIKDLTSRYLSALEDTNSPRLPLKPSLKHNAYTNTTSPLKKHNSPDLDDLARQMNIDTASKPVILKANFGTPSATVSSFQSSSGSHSVKSLAEESPKSPTKGSLKTSKGYEYLCRILAIKNWLEIVINEPILQTPVELMTYIQNGIHLAKLANVFLPLKKAVYTKDSRLEFRHTENINRFFKLLDFLEIPDLFRFELTDLYDAKDVPKVWFCLHAMSYKINVLNSLYPQIQNLVDRIDFSEGDIRTANRALVGRNLPNFTSADTNNPESPGKSSYMNNTLKFNSPTKSPIRSPIRRPSESENDNPFREPPKLKPAAQASSFEQSIRSVLKVPDLVRSPSISESISNYNYSRVDKTSKYYTPELEDNVDNIIKLQALSMGALFRYKMFVDKIMLKSFDSEMTEFNSIIRGFLSRSKTVHRHRDELLFYKKSIVRLQAIARGKLLKLSFGISLADGSEPAIITLQGSIRRHLIQSRVQIIKDTLQRNAAYFEKIQSVIRRKPVHSVVSTITQNRKVLEDGIINLQSAARRKIYLGRNSRKQITELFNGNMLIELQSLIRAGTTRNKIRFQLRWISRERVVVRELQSIGRGAITRTRLCNKVLITLLGEDIKMNQLFAKARGDSVRRKVQFKKDVLNLVEGSEIVPLQSAFRGVFLRFRRDVILDEIYDEVDNLVGFQSIVRAALVRNDIQGMITYYRANSAKVVKAQAILRSKYTQKAYKALINLKKPPVSVVRRFAYLLSDNETDYLEEMELAEFKDQILEKSRLNEDLELRIENLEIKLGLLDKNKITLEDFMKGDHKYKAFEPSAKKAANMKCLEKLNKSSRRRIELYQSLLYLLQTKPAYWTRIFDGLAASDRGKITKSLQFHISLLFPLAGCPVHSHTREEYFFVKFICDLMENDFSSRCNNITDITKPKLVFWIDYLNEMNNGVQQRSHLKHLFGKIMQKVIMDDELTFESDPSKIYIQAMERELEVYGSSKKRRDILPQSAIRDELISSAFVENLLSLREFTTDAIETIQRIIPQIPLHVRLLAKHAYENSRQVFPDQNEQLHLAVAGVIIIKHYISSIFVLPENYGYSIRHPSGKHDSKVAENLKSLSRVLLQTFSMRPFSDNFLKPMNEYVMSQVDTIKWIIKDIIRVKSLESEYEVNEYDDIVAVERPTLTMRISDIILLEKLVAKNLEASAPSVDDQLCTVISELEDVVNTADDYIRLTELGSLTLSLTPITKEDSVADAKCDTLFSQAKRCILYILQVQEGDDLLELLIQGIKPEHEEIFKDIVELEKEASKTSMLRQAANYRSSTKKISQMSYIELKKMALKVILQLESMGKVTRKNSFQEILNQLVLDIKTKDKRRGARKSQLQIASMTVNKLSEKEKFLTRQLNDYNKHIETVLLELQLKPKDKKIFNIIPVFSKQYFYQRELKKSNRLPKFGSYKYSAKKLLDLKTIEDCGGALQRAQASSSKLDFMFSCHKVGSFVIEAGNGTVTIPGASNSITLDDLLEKQYEGKKQWVMFDGMVTFDTDKLAALLFRKFYDLKRD